MADVVTFDGPNKLIIEISAAGDNELDLVEVYSEAKFWMTQSDNLKYLQIFAVVGGDPITPTQNLGSTFFLENGWRIRPSEEDHKLTIVGNLFTREAGQSAFVPVLGAYTVNTETRVSSLVDSSVARLDLAQLLQAVYIDTINGVSGTDEGVGTPTNPVDNITDAFTIATRDNLRGYKLRGSITLDQDYDDWTFEGIGAETASTIDLNGQNIDKSHFSGALLTGAMIGSFEAHNCGLAMTSSIAGVFRSCGLINNFSLQPSGIAVFSDCFSEVAGFSTPICDMNGATEVSFRNYSGGIELLNTLAGMTASVDLDPGSLVLGPTNTGGTVLVRGAGTVRDTSNGTTVINEVLDGPGFQILRKLMQNRMETNPTTGIMTIYDDDDVTPLLTANIFEDVLAGQIYRGRGMERRDRMS
jgi:hypothetical protein